MLFVSQTAVVTGAGSGIGRAIAIGLGAQGARVWLVGRNRAALAETAALASCPVVCHPCDLTEDRSVDELARRLEKESASLDILVHSAGVIGMGPVSEAPVEELDAQYRTNLRAAYVLTQATLPMLRRSRGQVVFINSTAGISARAGIAQYAATKHGLKALADSLRNEVNPDGVRVLSIFLGRTATPMQRAVQALEGRVYQPECLVQPDDVGAMTVAALGLARTAEVTNMAIRPFRRPETAAVEAQ